MSNQLIITRAELTKVLKDHRLVVLFESLFTQALISTPTDVTTAQTDASLAQVTADTAQVTANTALATAIDAQADASDALGQLATLGTMSAQNANSVSITGGSITANLTNNQLVLLHSSATLSDYAGGFVGTLTNAPSAGDPVKWIAVNDNGTTRRIPTW